MSVTTLRASETSLWLVLRCPSCSGQWPISKRESQDPLSDAHLCPSCNVAGKPRGRWKKSAGD